MSQQVQEYIHITIESKTIQEFSGRKTETLPSTLSTHLSSQIPRLPGRALFSTQAFINPAAFRNIYAFLMEIDSLVYVLVIMYLCIHYVLFVYERMCICINFLIVMTKHLTYTSYRMELTLDPTVRGCSSPWQAEQLTPAGQGPWGVQQESAFVKVTPWCLGKQREKMPFLQALPSSFIPARAQVSSRVQGTWRAVLLAS